MSGNSFAFPPPPPPPQQAIDTQHPPAGNTCSRGRGSQRWERGPRNRGRGNTYRGSRGGNQQFGGNTQFYAVNNANQHGGAGYPLPNYPRVQQPQYPLDSHSAYSNPPSPYYPVAGPPVPRQTPSPYPAAYPNTQTQSVPYPQASLDYYAQAQQHQSYQPQSLIPHTDHRYASPPMTMGPPIRLGFGDEQSIDPRQHASSHQYQGNSAMDFYSQDSLPPSRGGSSYRARGGGHPPQTQPGRGRGRGRGQGSFSRRGNSDAPTASHALTRKTQVAPAVPSFGNPLPLKPPIPHVDDTKPGKKKKRRANQLGLTPKTGERVSSSEEEDVDEELKLGVAAGRAAAPGQQLEIKYRGQTSTLQSSADIASWIEERRKRFPTAARKAENDARLEKIRQEREQKREEKKQAFEAERLFKRQLKTLENDKQAAREKAKLKVEKLRRKLEKEERRIAKAEAKSLKRSAPKAEHRFAHGKKRKRSQGDSKLESVESESADSVTMERLGILEVATIPDTNHTAKRDTTPVAANEALNETLTILETGSKEDPATMVPGPLTPTSQLSLPEQEPEPQQEPEPESGLADRDVKDPRQLPGNSYNAPRAGPLPKDGELQNNVSSGLSDISESSDATLDEDEDDETSSSGSSSISGSDDGEPEAVSSRHQRAQKVPPPRRNDKQGKAICRDFLRTGRCRRGERCRWRHALPDRKQKQAPDVTVSRPERKSLHRRLLDQQEETERAEKKRLEQQTNNPKHTQITAA